MLYRITDGTVSIGGECILSHIFFEIKGNEKIAVVGGNGAGKTTLCRLLAGELEPDPDDKRKEPVLFRSRDFSCGYLRQQFSDHSDRTVLEEKEILYSGKISEEQKNSFQKQPEASSRMLDSDFTGREKNRFFSEYDSLFTRFGFELAEETKKLKEFSGGEQTKIALIGLLLRKPELLILDEPTNHLDLEAVEWLETYLKNYPGAVVMVSHDRYFLDRTAEIIYECENRSLIRYPGNYSHYREEKAKRYELQKKAWNEQQEKIEQLTELIRRFKNRPTKASMTRAKKKELERMEKVEKPREEDAPVRFPTLSPAVKGSKWVWEAEHLLIGYEEPLGEVNLRIRRGQKIGIIGPNGAGKSTLLKTAAGILRPLSGKKTLGGNVQIGYFEQMIGRPEENPAAGNSLTEEKPEAGKLLCEEKSVTGENSLPEEETTTREKTEIREKALSVREHFQKRFPSLSEKEARSFLGACLFPGRDAEKPVSALSGGEYSRLLLAELLQECPNFLLLDEPTNHMDIPSMERLEGALKAYEGTLLFTTHDRYFLKEAAESLLVFENGKVTWYPFGYDHYEEHKSRNPGEMSMSERVREENQALLAGLKAVPKKEFHETRISSEELAGEWAAAGRDEKLEYAFDRYEREYWEGAEMPSLDRLTDDCLLWYEKWCEQEEQT